MTGAVGCDGCRSLRPRASVGAATPGEMELRRAEGGVVEKIIRPTGLIDPEIEIHSVRGQVDDLLSESHKRVKVGEREMDRSERIIASMPPGERRRPELIKGSRRLRIAKGSGTNVQQVNQLVKQFGQMRKMMKGLARGKMPDLGALMRQGR